MQIQQKLSKQITSLSNGYINKGPREAPCCHTAGTISKAHLQAPGTLCIRNSVSLKYLWPGVLPPR